jgi:hypothetical protein
MHNPWHFLANKLASAGHYSANISAIPLPTLYNMAEFMADFLDFMADFGPISSIYGATLVHFPRFMPHFWPNNRFQSKPDILESKMSNS